MKGRRGALRIVCVLLCAMCLIAGAAAQTAGDGRMRFGVKAGLCALQPDLTAIRLGGVGLTASDAEVWAGAGYTAGAYMHISIRRIFLRPSLTWVTSHSRLAFDLLSTSPGITSTAAFPQAMTLRVYSLEAPLMVGCHLVKQQPFELNLMGGVKVKYNYLVRLTPDSPGTAFDFHGDDSPRHWSVCAALEVRIDRLTFDVGYEYGMNSLRAVLDNYVYRPGASPVAGTRLARRMSGLSLTVGAIF